MIRKLKRLAVLLPLIAVLVGFASSADAKTLKFAGRDWNIKDGTQLGPGPNNWSENNAWVDTSGYLHLKITNSNGKWYCAEVSTTDSLSFGVYEWEVVGQVDKLNPNAVLGLFSYAGPDNQNEIDIEFSRWGDAKNNPGNFTVWPAQPKLESHTMAFPFKLSKPVSLEGYLWEKQRVAFAMLGQEEGKEQVIARWQYDPTLHQDSYLDYIPQQPMPVHMNLWLVNGAAPTDKKDIEVVIRGFAYHPNKSSD